MGAVDAVDPLPITMRGEVLAWIAGQPGRGAGQAVSHFVPQAEGAKRVQLIQRVRTWGKRAKVGGQAIARTVPRGAEEGAEVGQKAPPLHPPPPEVNVWSDKVKSSA